jgi:hypothetical protein
MIIGARNTAKMFLWPLTDFWTFTPWGYALAIVWNVCELAGVVVPHAPWVFGVIIGCAGKKVQNVQRR